MSAETSASHGVAPDRIVRRPELARLTGLSLSTLWRLEQRGDFPSRRRLSANSVGWVETEVLAWVHGREKCALEAKT